MKDDQSASHAVRLLFVPVNTPNPGWPYNAWVERPDINDQWDDYADGYRALADIGVDHAWEKQAVDILIHPVIFCYRQYLELRLKELILMAGDLLDQSLALPTNHDFNQLWAAVRPLLERIRPSLGTKEEFEKVENVLDEFTEVDPRSMAFRYPFDREGNKSLPGIHIINLKTVKEVIDGIAPILDGLSTGLSEYLADKREMMAEGRRQARYYASPP